MWRRQAFLASAAKCEAMMTPLPTALDGLARLLADEPVTKPAEWAKPAGVLGLLTVTDQTAEILVVVRPGTLRFHAGQVAFPGGSFEPRDGDLWETALREAEEEVGIRREEVVRVGALPSVHITVSGFTIRPWIAWAPRRPSLVLDPFEVERAFWVPLTELRAVHRRAFRERAGVRFETPEYPVCGVVIWGATGRMLEHLLARFTPEDQGLLERGESWNSW